MDSMMTTRTAWMKTTWLQFRDGPSNSQSREEDQEEFRARLAKDGFLLPNGTILGLIMAECMGGQYAKAAENASRNGWKPF